MNEAIRTQIFELEEQLKTAMLNSDVDALDRLLAPDLMFTNHLGQLLSKEDDLDAHRSGRLQVKDLTAFEQNIRLFENMAVVSVRMRLTGTYDGQPADGDFRFTRVWCAAPAKDSWHVVAAHAVLLTLVCSQSRRIPLRGSDTFRFLFPYHIP